MKRQQPESILREKVGLDLKALRIESGGQLYFRKIFGALNGTPDFLICLCGKFVALELKKSAREKPDPLQVYNLNAIKKSEGMTFVVHPDNWAAVLSELRAACFKNTEAV